MRRPLHIRSAMMVLALVFAIADSFGAYPLPVPTRPTHFPLSRPHDLGTVIAMGSNSGGQTNIPPHLGKCVAIAAGFDYSMALRPDGTVVAWGTNTYGQCAVPASLTNVVAITAGQFFAAALREDGTVVQWGYDIGGLPPSWLHDVVQISAGYLHMLALRADGTVVGWGDNGSRQINIPFEASNAVAISAAFGSAALTAEGRIIGWGFGNFQPPPISPPGYVAIAQGGAVKLRNDGFVEGMSFQSFVQRDILAVSGGANNFGAVIFTPSRFIWFQTGTFNSGGIVPGVVNALAISSGSSHVLGLVGDSPSAPCLAAARMVNGFIVGIDVLNGGNNYDYVPVVNIVGGGGSDATAVAQVVDGVVTGFTVTNAGHGYTDVPEVQIGSPWFEPTVTVTANIARFNVVTDLVPGDQYVLDQSSDLATWTSVPFTATTNLLSFPLESTNAANFVRLSHKP